MEEVIWQCGSCGRVGNMKPSNENCGCKMNGTVRPVMRMVTYITRHMGDELFLYQCPVCKTVKLYEHSEPLCEEEHFKE